MLTEHQGEGTYDYTCRCSDCFYCQFFGIKSIGVREVSIRQTSLIKHRYSDKWTDRETQTLIELHHLKSRALQSYLPGRSESAIVYKKYMLKRGLKIAC